MIEVVNRVSELFRPVTSEQPTGLGSFLTTIHGPFSLLNDSCHPGIVRAILGHAFEKYNKKSGKIKRRYLRSGLVSCIDWGDEKEH